MPRLHSEEPILQQCSEQSSHKRKKVMLSKCTHLNALCSPKEGISRKFLLCADKNKLVPVDQLLKKHLGLLFVKLTNSDHLPFLQPLICVYDELCRKFPGCFEIVFVAVFLDYQSPNPLHRQHLFDLHLSRMPWPALPFDDNSKWSEHVELRHRNRTLRHDSEFIKLFNPSGLCLTCDALEDLLMFGPDIYPFTQGTINELMAQYHHDVLMQPLSLETMLSSSKVGRNFLITLADGDEYYKRVPISQLHGNVVGLFFYHGWPTPEYEDRDRVLLEKLHRYHIRSKGSFKVVFINIDYDRGYQSEASFHDFMKKWPWLLALPFKDDKIRALSLVLDQEVTSDDIDANRLVIVGGDGEKFLLDPHGYSIIKKYGFKAYPFTRDKVIELEKKRLCGLKLADVFGTTCTEFLFRVGRKKKEHVSYLQGKRVLLYIGRPTSVLDISKIQALEEKEKSLSVVLVENKTLYKQPLYVLPKNWLIYSAPMMEHMEDRLFKKLKVYLCGDFMVFDERGDFLTMGFLSVIRNDFPNDFPFVSDKTFDEEFRGTILQAKDQDWILEVRMK